MQSSATYTDKIYKLLKETELRIELDEDDSLEIELIDGFCEVFGSELGKGRKYTIENTSLALFTWQGCEISISGSARSVYVGSHTPNHIYVNLHAQLEKLRKEAQNKNHEGPRVMIVGANGTGKSSLVRRLCTWAIRTNWLPTHIDLDLSLNAISLPGCIAATTVVHPAFDINLPPPSAPLAFYIGQERYDANECVFDEALGSLADIVTRRHTSERNKGEIRHAGCIIDTGVDILQDNDKILSIAEKLRVDLLVVLGNDRLHAQLEQLYNNRHDNESSESSKKPLSMVSLPHNSGAIAYSEDLIPVLRNKLYHRYFFGDKNISKSSATNSDGNKYQFKPFDRSLHSKNTTVYSTSNLTLAPASALPLGMSVDDRASHSVVSLNEVPINSILAVSSAKDDDKLFAAPIYGFLRVKTFNYTDRSLVCMSSVGGHLPAQGKLIYGPLQWYG